MKAFNDWLNSIFCTVLGADKEVALKLAAAVELDHDRKMIERQEKQGSEGITFGDMKIFAMMAMGMVGLGLGALSFFMADRVAILVWVILAGFICIQGLFAATYLSSMMAADEGFRVIASWPVSSRDYLASRLLTPLRGAIWLVILMCLPAALVTMIVGGIPVLTGFLFLGVCCVSGLALMIAYASLLGAMMRKLEPEQTTVGSLLVGTVLFFLVNRLMELYGPFDTIPLESITYYHMPDWMPITWLTSIVMLGLEKVPLHHLLLAALALVILPLGSFRMVAQRYTRSLGRSHIHKSKARGGFWARILTLNSKRKADKALASLCLAHGRADWRFRAQLYMLPFMVGGMVISPLLQFDVSTLFSDPMVHDDWWNAAMVWLIVVAFPPVLAVPLLASSKDYRASWILQLSPLPKEAFAAAERHVMRVVFVFPIILFCIAGYVYYEAPWLSILGHVIMMGLIAEVMVCGMQNLFSNYPFALPADDEEFTMRLLPVFFVYEALSVLIAGLIFHVLYRWWWAYLVGAGVLLTMRWFFIRGRIFTTDDGDGKPQQEEVVETQAEVVPLIGAVKAGHVHTAQLLLKAGHSPHTEDASGKSALQWAEGNVQMLELLKKYAAEESV